MNTTDARNRSGDQLRLNVAWLTRSVQDARGTYGPKQRECI